MLGSLLLLTAPAPAETLPPGTPINEAVSVNVTEEGLDAVGALLPALIPTDIPVDPVSQSVDLWVCEPGIWMDNIQVDVSVSSVGITLDNGQINLDAELAVGINSASDLFSLDLDYCLGDTSCPGYVQPFPVYLNTYMTLDVDPETGLLVSTVGELQYELGLEPSDDLHLDCGIQTLEDVLGYLGISIYDFIFDIAIGTLTDSLGDLTGDLDTTLNEALSAAYFEDDIEILDGIELHVELAPYDVVIEDGTLKLVFSGLTEAPPHECVEAWDPGGSLGTYTPIPDGSDGMVAAMVSDDFANQALYTLWRSGLLCYELQDLSGLTLDTSLLGLLAGDAFDEMFEEASPIAMVTRPMAPPEAVYDGQNDVAVAIKDLGLDIYADVDGRSSRVLGLGLGLDAGVDLDFDGSTGELGILLDLDPNDFDVAVTANAFVPDASDDIAANFSGVFNSLVGPLIDGLLGDSLAFAIPAFEGFGLSSIEISSAGEASDWLSLDAYIGVVPYESTGCSDKGKGGKSGDCSSGCSGGCSSAGSRSRWMMLFLPLGLMLLRRRR